MGSETIAPPSSRYVLRGHEVRVWWDKERIGRFRNWNASCAALDCDWTIVHHDHKHVNEEAVAHVEYSGVQEKK